MIPRARHPEAELELAEETRQFRTELMQLFQRRLEELGPKGLHDRGAGQEDLLRPSPRLRRQLDRCPQIRAANARRSELQDRLWATVLEAIADDRNRLEAVFESHKQGPGELVLDPDLVVPAHQLQTDIHRMPGGYLQDRAEDGFLTGVLYDHGVFLYGQGWLGPCNDAIGRTLIEAVLAEHHSSLQPRRILDLGCSVGHSTLPYVQAFPEAEVWGIDLGASLLRHASVRARLLNLPCHFAQQDAERTGFEAGSFDLVVSHILLHEIPGAARRRLFAESHRLLRPGGVMVHLDSALFLRPATAVSRYFRDTEVAANGEPYLASSSLDAFPGYALEAGFAPERFHIRPVPGSPATAPGKAPPAWFAFCAERS